MHFPKKSIVLLNSLMQQKRIKITMPMAKGQWNGKT